MISFPPPSHPSPHPHLHDALAWGTWIFLAAFLSGCGLRGMPAADIEGRTRSFDEASSRLASGDFTGAKSAATQALDGGGLSADQASEATLILIEAAIESGDIPLAQAALANAESTAMDLARVFVLQGRLAQKQGNESAAQTAFARARTEDPNIAIPQR